MHPGNFGFDKIIRPSVGTSTVHASVVEGIYNVCLNCYGQHINSRQKTTSADQCHMTVSQARVYNTLRSQVYFKFSASQLLIFNWSQAQVHFFHDIVCLLFMAKFE